MSEKDLGRAMLSTESMINATALADRVTRRDRRRMWFLGIVCVIAWMLVVMLPWSTTLPVLAKVVEYQAQTSGTAPMPQDPADPVRLLEIVRKGTIATFIGSIASMFVAAVSTVALIIFSRRATMRQINARLADLSAELRTAARGR